VRARARQPADIRHDIGVVVAELRRLDISGERRTELRVKRMTLFNELLTAVRQTQDTRG
jgi:hypothetical protein